jgi:hypothetical protein
MIANLCRDWNGFWFSPRPRQAVTRLRVAVCCVTGIWFLSFLPACSTWFAADGLLPLELVTQLNQFDQIRGWQTWSPLWLSDALALHYGWLYVGALLSALAAVGVGSRISLAILLVWVIAWAQRITWLQGLVEPALVASIAYLVVEPGRRLWSSSDRIAAAENSWRAGLVVRLFQTHWWLLVAAGLLSQLANLIWWRGEGIWWLAAAGRSMLFTTDMLHGQASLTNALSHAVCLLQVLALWFMLIPSARPLGIAAAVLVAGIYGIVADQLLYALLLLAMGLSYLTPGPLSNRRND